MAGIYWANNCFRIYHTVTKKILNFFPCTEEWSQIELLAHVLPVGNPSHSPFNDFGGHKTLFRVQVCRRLIN